MDIILFGIQGSGKGTQGKILKARYNMAYFETGAELRHLAQEESDLGKKVKEIISSGHLVSNEIVMEIAENFLNNIEDNKNVIWDGIPRKIKQAESLDKLLKNNNRDYKAVILELSKEEALKRLTTRRICSDCKEVYPATYNKDLCEKCNGKLITRHDDNPKSIKTRIQAYLNETTPVIELYDNRNKLLRVGGEGSIPEVSNELFEKLDPILS